MVSDRSKGKVLFIVGPTAVGKTSVAIRLASLLQTEIVSADSMQVYRHMDIGTAKPSLEELSMVPHHMIDIVEPWEYFSAGQYLEKVSGIIESLHARGKVPIITGGTGLYMRAITKGLFPSPPADFKLRGELLQQEQIEEGYLHKRLCELDPIVASRVNPKDHRRLLRALEVCLNTDSTMSELQQTNTMPLDYQYIKIGLTCSRDRLYSLINKRVDSMIDRGLIEEAKDVIDMILKNRPLPYGVDELGHILSFTSMQAIGYKELARYFYGELDKDTAIALIKQRTRNYAKRQFTWFRAEGDIRWIDTVSLQEAVLERVMECIGPLTL